MLDWGVDFVQIMSYQFNSYDPALFLDALDTIIPKYHSMIEDLELYSESMDSMELDTYERRFMCSSLTAKLDEFVPILKNDIASEYERLNEIKYKEVEERLGFKNVKDSTQ